jgi:hypothetical protein
MTTSKSRCASIRKTYGLYKNQELLADDVNQLTRLCDSECFTEDLLMLQSQALDAVFYRLLELAATDATGAILHMALRTQTQCLRTLMIVEELKASRKIEGEPRKMLKAINY